MADFEFSMDMDKIMPKGIQDENLALDMIDAGQDVMLNAIQAGANRHIVSGDMAKSLRKTKPYIDKKGDAVGRVKFFGSDKSSSRTNWMKAFRIEYGRSNQTAKPFVRPAIKSSEGGINSAMNRIFEQKAK